MIKLFNRDIVYAYEQVASSYREFLDKWEVYDFCDNKWKSGGKTSTTWCTIGMIKFGVYNIDGKETSLFEYVQKITEHFPPEAVVYISECDQLFAAFRKKSPDICL